MKNNDHNWPLKTPKQHRKISDNRPTQHKYKVSKVSKIQKIQNVSHMIDQRKNKSDPSHTPPMNYGTPEKQGLMNLTVLALF
jgi:hypothetical protein